MRTISSSRRWVLFGLAALIAALTVPAGSANGAPMRQDPEFTIFAIGFVDMFGGNDPNCPGCDGVYQPDDETFAANNPLPQLEFFVLDTTGTEVARATTDELSSLQRAEFVLPALVEGEEYTLELVAAPDGWELCPNESKTRVLAFEDFQLDSVREDFHFWQGCQDGGATATPTEPGPGETPTMETPGGPTPVPPTDMPDDGDDDEDKGASSRADGQRLGSIKGLVFIDTNQDGALGSSEPGLNDVGVHLRGGGLDLFQVTGGTGQFSFDGLGAGEYDVFIQPGPEWRVTTPSLYKVKVNGNVVMGIDFGLVRIGEPAKPAAPVRPGPVNRLPPTGVADLPTSGLLGIVALVLGAVAVVGFSFERRRLRDQA